MNRRTAIRNVMLVSAGAALIPSCLSDKAVFPVKNFSLTGSEEKLLAQLSQTILPGTPGFIGAKELRSHEFILTMVDDCVKPEDQQKFVAGVKAFDQTCKESQGSSFLKCTPAQRNAFLTLAENKKALGEDAQFFYGLTKRYTVQSFTSSQKYMTEVRKYNIVPGSRFKGCVPVKKA